MNRVSLSILILIFFLTTSCKTKKEALTSVGKLSKDYLIQRLEQNNKEFEWFYAKAKVHYEDEKRSKNFTATIHMKKDTVIWASLTTLLGIEAARVMITSDSVKIIDRMGKTYIERPLYHLEEFLPFRLAVTALQNIIIGNTLMDPNGKVKYKNTRGLYVLTSDNKKIKYSLWINPVDFSISTEYLTDRQEDREVTLIFDNYKTIEDKLFSYQRNINFKGEENVEIALKLTKVKWDEPLRFPFHVSDKYDRQ